MDFAILLLKVFVIYVGIIQVVPIMIWVERKGAALIQDRPGPNRVGPLGLFQPVADVIKFLFKEDPIPKNVAKWLYVISPFLLLIPASLVVAVIPFADYFEVFGKKIFFQISEIELGLLFILAISSLGAYGILFGGWSSNNKFSLLGAIRGSSQMLSYEIPLSLAASASVMFYGSLSLRDMIYTQANSLWGICYQPLGFLLFFICAFAETNRLPFDLSESEAELVGGYHTEYGSMKFAVFFMAEYINMAVASCVMVAMYLGGWHIPFLSENALLSFLGSRNLLALLQVSVVVTKASLFMLVFVWIRWTVPRFRFDQLMLLAWRNLIPLSIANFLITAVAMYWFR